MDKHSPTPWRVSHGYIVFDADGVSIANAWRDADAALIVEAVNDYEWAIGEIHKMTVEHDELFDEAVEIRKERDRLRDLVRRLAGSLQSIIDAAEGRGTGRLDEGLVREAREALGEAQP